MIDREMDINKYINQKFKDYLFEQPISGPTYITPDGYFLSIIDIANDMGEGFPEDFPCHGAIQTLMMQDGVAEKAGSYDDGSPVLRENGFIRLNDVEAENNYIELSKLKPTNEQYEALEKWLDKNSLNFESVNICTEQFNNAKQYFYSDETVDEIIKKIKRFYTTGELLEKIVKKGSKWQVQSEKGRNMGTYDTKEEAEKRLKQIEYFKHLDEAITTDKFELGTCGYIKEDGSFIILDEYHGEDESLWGFRYPEFSNTHAEEDTCIRLYKEPNDIQYSKLEEIIDIYLDKEDYCKVEIWNTKTHQPEFYKIFSLRENACEYSAAEEQVGNWTGYKLVRMIKNYYNKLNESLLLEKKRSELISKSRSSDKYKTKGRENQNRWDRRTKSRIAATVADYNNIDMNAFFKGDILNFGVKVQGETNNYVVIVTFEGILKHLRDEIVRNKNKLEFKCVVRALMNSFNSEDVYVSCSCPDWKYRQAYWSTQGKYNSGTPQTDNGMMIANPGDTKGAGCKHVNLVLSNLNWCLKLASTINNYINYCKDKMEVNYQRYIFPVVYGKEFDDVIRNNDFIYNSDDSIDTDLLDDEATINLANALGRVRGRFKKKEPVQFEQEESTLVDDEIAKLNDKE